MREIKFRAWDSAKQRMTLENDLLAVSFIGEVIHFGNGVSNRGDLTVMQYTGLKDKNGVEIYEGDIVRLVDSDIPRTVEFDKSCFVLTNRQESAVSYRELWEQQFPEVIGNIYQNPDY